MSDHLAELLTLCDEATPGPWGWFGNTQFQDIYLATVGRGRRFVMGFRRWGMHGAQPQFQPTPQDGRAYGLVDAADIAIYEVAPSALSAKDERVYRQDVIALRNPDAKYIAAANPSVVAALVRVVHAYQRVVVTDASGEPHYVTANGVPQEIPASLRRPLAAALAALDEALR